jgi:hypothetical protein
MRGAPGYVSGGRKWDSFFDKKEAKICAGFDAEAVAVSEAGNRDYNEEVIFIMSQKRSLARVWGRRDDWGARG